MICGFCVWEKKFICGPWQFQIVQLLCLPFSVLLYFYFEVFDRLAGFAHQLSIFVVLHICSVLWARCSKSCFHDTWRLLNSQPFIYTCIYFQFSSACLFPSVHLQMWNYFEVFLVFSHKMYHHHDFIFSLLQHYLNMTLKPKNKLTWHHCIFTYSHNTIVVVVEEMKNDTLIKHECDD
jgi:hypothetical protein